MKKYIAYYRVSTKEQGNSNLGLSAQKSSVKAFTSDGELISQFEEVESGRNCDRKVLAKAIEEAIKHSAKLVIAKLDRLSRDVKFIYTLRDSGVDFICVDMPDANTLTIGIMAVLAEEEARRVSERTKSALAEIKKKIDRGEEHISKSGQIVTKLGGKYVMSDSDRDKAKKAIQSKADENENNKRAFAFIEALVNSKANFKQITDKLNSSGFTTSRGGKFYPAQTKRLYERYR